MLGYSTANSKYNITSLKIYILGSKLTYSGIISDEGYHQRAHDEARAERLSFRRLEYVLPYPVWYVETITSYCLSTFIFVREQSSSV